MADLVYINEAEGKKRLMNNDKLYAKLLSKFRTETNLEDLFTYADAQDWEKTQIEIHTIKGVAANLSLIELFNQALVLETQVKEKSLNPGTLENLKTCFDETVSQADKVIAKYA